MADFSYLSGNAPQAASYRAPDMAKQLYEMLGGIPQDIAQAQQSAFQQQQNARTTALQQPVTGPNGQPSTNINDILQALNQRGGLEAAVGQLPFMFKQQYLDKEQGGGQPQPAPQAPKPSNDTSILQGPDMLHRANDRQQAANDMSPAVGQGGVTRLADDGERLPGDEMKARRVGTESTSKQVDRPRDDPAEGSVPDRFKRTPGYSDSRSYADRLDAEGDGLSKKASDRDLYLGAGAGKALEAQAADKHSQAAAIRGAWTKDAEKTGAEKEFRAGGRPGEDMRTFEAGRAGAVTGATNEATEVGKNVAEIGVSGLNARGHLAQLDAIQELGNKVPYGVVPKLQSILGEYGIETKGLSDIQAFEGALKYLAPQLRPPGSGRLMQKEYDGFIASMGGLMTTPEGRQLSVENLKLLANYQDHIGTVARDRSLTPAERMELIGKVRLPHLKTLDDVREGKGSGGYVPQATNATQVPAEGATVINRQTGQRLKLQGGQWLPAQ